MREGVELHPLFHHANVGGMGPKCEKISENSPENEKSGHNDVTAFSNVSVGRMRRSAFCVAILVVALFRDPSHRDDFFALAGVEDAHAASRARAEGDAFDGNAD